VKAERGYRYAGNSDGSGHADGQSNRERPGALAQYSVARRACTHRHTTRDGAVVELYSRLLRAVVSWSAANARDCTAAIRSHPHSHTHTSGRTRTTPHHTTPQHPASRRTAPHRRLTRPAKRWTLLRAGKVFFVRPTKRYAELRARGLFLLFRCRRLVRALLPVFSFGVFAIGLVLCNALGLFDACFLQVFLLLLCLFSRDFCFLHN